MSSGEAINTCFAKCAMFSGRTARPEYWYWVLLWISAEAGDVLSWIFNIATIIPPIAVAVRRLHDTDVPARHAWPQSLG